VHFEEKLKEMEFALEMQAQERNELLVRLSDSAFRRETLQDSVRSTFDHLFEAFDDLDKVETDSDLGRVIDALETSIDFQRDHESEGDEWIAELLMRHVKQFSRKFQMMIIQVRAITDKPKVNEVQENGDSEVDAYAMRLLDLDARVKMLEEEKENLQNSNAFLHADLSESMRLNEKHQSRISELELEVQRKTENSEQHQEKIDDVSVEANIAMLQAALETRTSENSRLDDECHRLGFELKEKSKVLASTESELVEKSAALENLTGQFLSLEEEHTECKHTISVLRRDLDDNKKHVEQLERESEKRVTVLETTIRELEHSIDIRDGAVNRLEAELFGLKSEHEECLHACEEAKERAMAAEATVSQLESQVEELSAERRRLVSEAMESEATLKDLKSESAALRDLRQCFDGEHELLQAQLEETIKMYQNADVARLELIHRCEALESERRDRADALQITSKEELGGEAASNFLSRLEQKLSNSSPDIDSSAKGTDKKLVFRIENLMEERKEFYSRLDTLRNQYIERERRLLNENQALVSQIENERQLTAVRVSELQEKIVELTRNQNQICNTSLSSALSGISSRRLSLAFTDADGASAMNMSVRGSLNGELDDVMTLFDGLISKPQGLFQRNSEVARKVRCVLSGEGDKEDARDLMRESQKLHDELCAVIKEQDSVIHRLHHERTLALAHGGADESMMSNASEVVGIAVMEHHLTEIRKLWLAEVETSRQLRALLELQEKNVRAGTETQHGASARLESEKDHRLAQLTECVEHLEWKNEVLRRDASESCEWLAALCDSTGERLESRTNVYLMRDAVESYIKRNSAVLKRYEQKCETVKQQNSQLVSNISNMRAQKKLLLYLYSKSGHLAPQNTMRAPLSETVAQKSFKTVAKSICVAIRMRHLMESSSSSLELGSEMNVLVHRIPEAVWSSEALSISASIAVAAVPRLEKELAKRNMHAVELEKKLTVLHVKLAEAETKAAADGKYKGELEALREDKARALADAVREEAIREQLNLGLAGARKELSEHVFKLEQERSARKKAEERTEKYATKLKEYAKRLDASKRQLQSREKTYRSAVGHLKEKLTDWEGRVEGKENLVEKTVNNFEQVLNERKSRAVGLLETMLLTARKDLEDALDSNASDKTTSQMKTYIDGLEKASAKLKSSNIASSAL